MLRILDSGNWYRLSFGLYTNDSSGPPFTASTTRDSLAERARRAVGRCGNRRAARATWDADCPARPGRAAPGRHWRERFYVSSLVRSCARHCKGKGRQMDFRRYAVYYTPSDPALARFGARWLGWD
ncbi:MAG: hypothetical protein K8F31_11580, partial [Roseovarius sp.]|nr:hypothetical protein [Roseovarius sp.]